MKIGELARWAKCPAVTIRYYEKIGLMPDGQRDRLNHRIYNGDDVERLRFILHCRNHGIAMSDLRVLLALRDDSGRAESDAVMIIRKHIKKLQHRRESLDLLIGSLTSLLALAGDDNGREIIDALGSPCPHCPDYAEKARSHGPANEIAACLATPEIRRDGDVLQVVENCMHRLA